MAARLAPDPDFRAVMEAVWRRLETGTPLHEALKEHPSFFPEEISNLIQAGEESGKLPYAFGVLPCTIPRHVGSRFPFPRQAGARRRCLRIDPSAPAAVQRIEPRRRLRRSRYSASIEEIG